MNYLRWVRQHNGLRQVDIAERMGQTKQQISSLEQRFPNVTVKTLWEVTDAYELPVLRAHLAELFAERPD